MIIHVSRVSCPAPMEGPDIQGPQVWLDLNRKAEAKMLDYHKANLERYNWLDRYTEECKAKLGVQVSEEPSFVPKVAKFLMCCCVLNSFLLDTREE